MKELKQINRGFKAALKEPVELLYHNLDCGFFDGGCLILADALALWSHGNLTLGACRRVRYSIVDHWFVCMNIGDKNLVIDADGLKDEKAYLRFIEKNELREPGVIIDSPIHEPDSDIPRDEHVSAIVAVQIQAALGCYKAWKHKVEAALCQESALSR